MGNHTFMRLKWSSNPIKAEMWYGKPESVDFIKSQVKIGEEFNIKITDKKYCIGSESHKNGWITCKQRRLNDGEDADSANRFVKDSEEVTGNNIILLTDNRNYIQCYRCSSIEYFSCRMTCTGDVCVPSSELAKEYCTPATTAVYLTYVGDKYKIGVSLNPQRRWVEQGSDLACIVAKAPGLEARRLEQVAAQELGLTLQVRNNSKLSTITQHPDEDNKQKLQDYIERIKPISDRILKDVEGGSNLEPTIKEFSKYYGDFTINSPVQEIEPEAGQEFGGTIVGLKGSIIIVRQDVYYYAMDLKKLRSKTFKFIDTPAKMETQSYLDQWF